MNGHGRPPLSLSVSVCLPVTCLSCKAVSSSYEAFLDVPLDVKVRGLVACASGHPKAPVAFQNQRGWLKNASCDPKRAWWWAGSGMARVPLGRPWQRSACGCWLEGGRVGIVLSAPWTSSQPSSLCPPSAAVWLLAWRVVLFSLVVTLHTLGS